MTTERDPGLAALERLIGTWTTEATHPAMPGVVVRGAVVVAWLAGERFLTLRARTDHPAFPDSLAVVGRMGRDRVGADGDGPVDAAPRPLDMHYFDSRGVFRAYLADVDASAWRVWRDAPGFAQRFTGRFADGGDTIDGQWQLCEDGARWAEDVRITYRRGR